MILLFRWWVHVTIVMSQSNVIGIEGVILIREDVIYRFHRKVSILAEYSHLIAAEMVLLNLDTQGETGLTGQALGLVDKLAATPVPPLG